MKSKMAKWLTAVVVFFMLVVMVPQTSSAEELPTVILTEDTVLTADLYAHVVIGADGITLDGAGHVIAGDGTGVGINLTERKGVTIKNCHEHGFEIGILLDSSNHNTLSNNKIGAFGVEWQPMGISLKSSSFNTIADNLAGRNTWGLQLQYCNHNVITNNTASNGWCGFELFCSNNNTLTKNVAFYNLGGYGFSLRDSDHNTLRGNTALGAPHDQYYAARIGFYLMGSNENLLTKNSADNNEQDGFSLCFGSKNRVTDNTATHNKQDGFVFGEDSCDASRNLAVFNMGGGFGLMGCSNSTFFDNTARDNGWGFNVGMASHNILFRNTATSNHVGFVLNGYLFYNKFIKNEGCDNHGVDFHDDDPAGTISGHNLFVKNAFGTIG